jgi:L-threonylcarbamoyladenylate synthase
MTTDLIEIDQDQPSPQAIARAASIIRSGGLVAIPTDALYTLVADPFNLHAVASVFQAKGRETNRALPLLVSDVVMAEELSTELTGQFFFLARRFWPGPLTVIVPAAPKIPLKVTGNTGRLALRQARSAVANALLEWLGQPLISTSANISGQPTCRSGIDVFGTMDGRVNLVLDGGSVSGAPATTVDITGATWEIIREGAITRKELEACLDETI